MNYLAAILAVQQQWEKEGRGPLLTLKDSDHERGWDCLKRFGVRQGDWFVGLHVRDTDFKNARDSDIDTYRMAIESVTARGGWVIRMGNPSMPPLLPMPRVIDYAHSEARSDWMDVFLWARCRFFIGTQSGPYMVPSTFGVPCVLTNSFPMALPLPYQNINIYKLYWSEKEKRYMTFSEACASRVGLAESRKYISSTGVRLVDNTPEEINDVVLEMLERLEDKLAYSAGDEELQKRFKSLKPSFTNQLGISTDRIGRAFLQKYAHLL
jgi:putative glycosyltransferase (TIGR04372 family)